MEVHIDEKTFKKMGYIGLLFIILMFIALFSLDAFISDTVLLVAVKFFMGGVVFGYTVLMVWLKDKSRKQKMEKDKDEAYKGLVNGIQTR